MMSFHKMLILESYVEELLNILLTLNLKDIKKLSYKFRKKKLHHHVEFMSNKQSSSSRGNILSTSLNFTEYCKHTYMYKKFQ